MKRIGVITMHKPISYGSALQAYALQKKIEDIGYYVELIDYKYPNELHQVNNLSLKDYISSLASFMINILWGFSRIKKKRQFEKFYHRFFKLSSYYPTADALKKNPPIYDIYLTGSDQVWNPAFIKQDSTFLLSFVSDDKIKLSYASSFATKSIPENSLAMYKTCLSHYHTITVREHSGIQLVKDLTGKDAMLVCDPTLLLSKDEWSTISESSNVTVGDTPYILVFMLGYSFNPYPKARNIIHQIQKRLGLRTIYLDGNKHDLLEPQSRVIRGAGPQDFLKLIKNASYVITDSYHGTIFSSIYLKPFTAIIKSGNEDSRIVSFLNKIGNTNSAIPYDSTDVDICGSDMDSNIKLQMFSLNSSKVLKNMLDQSIR